MKQGTSAAANQSVPNDNAVNGRRIEKPIISDAFRHSSPSQQFSKKAVLFARNNDVANKPVEAKKY